ncbi:uncharacterized protein LOC110669541 [Hevea brasiliensis]|uniref:uncharacterized protein LOC110669541 n=1 Tax=Hevea brasiliensis TaxID=3981 RepID=UPI0025D6F59E|nr:uncharacterized protein LOC110669541 [Hevea brasiliensis]
MLIGHADGLSELGSSKDYLLSDPEPELDDDDDEFHSEQVLYAASFEELGENTIKYDTVIWVSISLLLALAWGVGILMLLYSPTTGYVLRKEISSRKLHVTWDIQFLYLCYSQKSKKEIAVHIPLLNLLLFYYFPCVKVSRPSFIPFWGVAAIEKCVPLSSVIDVIMEQGCIQSVYGIHTFRVERIASGKAAPVGELQVQGVINPALLRKVIITEAAKNTQDVGKGWKPAAYTGEGKGKSRTVSFSEGAAAFKSPTKSWKMTSSPRYASMEPRSAVPSEVVLNKLEEVSKSVKENGCVCLHLFFKCT